ncbi:peroxisomal copper amine oxidase [Fistulina hepatica ATCC 64428]|uniref:Amine oxidase n=1 Tax=Fistulina hepatica ATCC 64428 TaxID=1128425 RepID=A0A0D7AG98_9AGAR|nr:peroxisomal copper amine oxidase [Fistulina hepatica ATCC 64428]
MASTTSSIVAEKEFTPKANAAVGHPLDPLTPEEIAAVCLVVRKYAASRSVKAIRFITCYLLPPPKKAVLAALGISLTPSGKPEPAIPIVRKAEVDFIDIVEGHSYNVVLSLKDGQWVVDTYDLLPEGVQPQISVEELVNCEKIIKADPQVQQYAKDVGIEPEQIFCDGWAIGYDDRFPTQKRVQQALVFARFGEHENLYAHPMVWFPTTSSQSSTRIRRKSSTSARYPSLAFICFYTYIFYPDFPPRYKATPNGPVLTKDTTKYSGLDVDSLVDANRERIPPPLKLFDFLPDLMAKNDPKFKVRGDVTPLHILQPEGVSFRMNGNVLEWQNWKMHIAFHHREGVVLSTVTYNDNGDVRPLFYRLSLAEMVVPYGAPEHPHPRKFAFDAGEYGMGTMANELSLGCDCLGQIHYLPGAFVSHSGSAFVIKNVICIHEEDNGVLWKHTDYRPGGRSQTVRRRRLIVSMVCTLANYEYIWNYMFYQDGSVELEIRLTGILQVYVSADGEPNPHGIFVAPKVNAHYHQHLFSIRLDPMIDGLFNSVVETDILQLPDAPTGSEQNFAGNAFITRDTVLTQESSRPYDIELDRRWRIVNPARQHYSSGKDVGYVIGMKGGITPMLARDDGWAAERASFIRAPIWVCRDVEGPKGSRMWPSGKYVPQTRAQPEDSIGSWVAGKQNVQNEDILVYITVGTSHIPRPEDWPVMPVDHLNVTFKPQSFFTANPSMDVPGNKTDPHSVSAFYKEGDKKHEGCSCE